MSPLLAVRRALSAETLKLKRTLALGMILIAPSVIVVLNFFMLLQRGQQFLLDADTAWTSLARNITTFWALLMLPLFITLETALLGGVDHQDKQWKQLYALPLPRGAIYAAKWLISLALVGASTLVLWLETMGCGLLLQLLKPELALGLPIPAWELLQPLALIFLLAWLSISIGLFVGLRWPSFTVSIGFGMVAATINLMILNSEDWSKVYPWALPFYAYIIEGKAYLPTALALGVLGGLLVGVLGGWTIVRREVS